MNYREGNSRFFEAPEDGEENLHESLEGVDPETEDVVFVEESRCQNDTNTKRQLCVPTVDGVKGILTMLKEVEKDLVLML